MESDNQETELDWTQQAEPQQKECRSQIIFTLCFQRLTWKLWFGLLNQLFVTIRSTGSKVGDRDGAGQCLTEDCALLAPNHA